MNSNRSSAVGWDSVSGITLAANKTKRITLQLEQVDAPPAQEASRGNHQPPRIIQSSQSSKTVTPGGTVSFKVAARDPEKSALTFTWSASTGTPGAPDSGATHSRATWIAPACAVPGTPTTVTATVTNAFGLTTSTVFTLKGLPACVSRWVATGSMAAARGSHAAVALSNGKVLVSGGRDDGHGGRLASAELYDPATGAWSSAGAMDSPREHHTATLLRNGKVLVTGGSNGSKSLASAELYDGATGTWSPTGPMAVEHDFHTATLLPNGKVLVTGGTSTTDAGSSAELYDPATGTWSPAAPLITARLAHTATLLPNAQVLIAGGYSEGKPLASAELYTP